MAILVTGGTGLVGTPIVERLAVAGAKPRVLTRSPEQPRLPAGATPVKGDLADTDAARAALQGVTTLFLLVPNVADEFNQTLTALNLAREAGVRGIVYLSVYQCDTYADVPHITCKYGVERMIETLDLPVTVLRPAYFMQNDLRQRDTLLQSGIYGMPIGQKGVAMVDTRDIADIAAAEVLRRERNGAALPRLTLDVVGPDNLTGPALAELWSDALGRVIRYGGDDLDAFEQHMRAVMPSWFAYDLRLMLRHYQEHGMAATLSDQDNVASRLGHPPRSYRDFVTEAARLWAQG